MHQTYLLEDLEVQVVQLLQLVQVNQSLQVHQGIPHYQFAHHFLLVLLLRSVHQDHQVLDHQYFPK